MLANLFISCLGIGGATLAAYVWRELHNAGSDGVAAAVFIGIIALTVLAMILFLAVSDRRRRRAKPSRSPAPDNYFVSSTRSSSLSSGNRATSKASSTNSNAQVSDDCGIGSGVLIAAAVLGSSDVSDCISMDVSCSVD